MVLNAMVACRRAMVLSLHQQGALATRKMSVFVEKYRVAVAVARAYKSEAGMLPRLYFCLLSLEQC